ncbi:unnamed protein product [Cyprideis torosa]|uniref:Uncharacterized protein n=1 Tax=Cyprideis torosa TaxID=163714 RepID=A0A7R8ZKR7_9CRUS|nr:unnamed protein product [Cyprideis torosa]CAG0890022.1 unnamed protein product [Cyprideis torosa]
MPQMDLHPNRLCGGIDTTTPLVMTPSIPTGGASCMRTRVGKLGRDPFAQKMATDLTGAHKDTRWTVPLTRNLQRGALMNAHHNGHLTQALLEMGIMEILYGPSQARISPYYNTSFTCPLCGLGGLGEMEVCGHVVKQHKEGRQSTRRPVLCPLCVSSKRKLYRSHGGCGGETDGRGLHSYSMEEMRKGLPGGGLQPSGAVPQSNLRRIIGDAGGSRSQVYQDPLASDNGDGLRMPSLAQGVRAETLWEEEEDDGEEDDDVLGFDVEDFGDPMDVVMAHGSETPAAQHTGDDENADRALLTAVEMELPQLDLALTRNSQELASMVERLFNLVNLDSSGSLATGASGNAAVLPAPFSQSQEQTRRMNIPSGMQPIASSTGRPFLLCSTFHYKQQTDAVDLKPCSLTSLAHLNANSNRFRSAPVIAATAHDNSRSIQQLPNSQTPSFVFLPNVRNIPPDYLHYNHPAPIRPIVPSSSTNLRPKAPAYSRLTDQEAASVVGLGAGDSMVDDGQRVFMYVVDQNSSVLGSNMASPVSRANSNSSHANSPAIRRLCRADPTVGTPMAAVLPNNRTGAYGDTHNGGGYLQQRFSKYNRPRRWLRQPSSVSETPVEEEERFAPRESDEAAGFSPPVSLLSQIVQDEEAIAVNNTEDAGAVTRGEFVGDLFACLLLSPILELPNDSFVL